eukprot:CAMPEP_0119101682 /NCGR_PEP_ID=MMETSP1180-20130426/670_1 /TAXON_ID=3052 ORGANISM="Chlamydomonas cf sp, Strain CCMP681" /NCGR_SAMPLE_ID=MMETSP1180 /ASSEMBLY_ACC=CAM_ASM_000741 /LENGTH=67 /DNA_ID=CAMNT_0007085843 /DNA_START=365 /DNA_END=568 /DNA_ORIENTATION=-
MKVKLNVSQPKSKSDVVCQASSIIEQAARENISNQVQEHGQTSSTSIQSQEETLLLSLQFMRRREDH